MLVGTRDIAHTIKIVVTGDQDRFAGTARRTGRVGYALGEVRFTLRCGRELRIIVMAVISALKFEDLLAASEATGKPHGMEGRFRAAYGKAELLDAGHMALDHLGELDRRLVQIGEIMCSLRDLLIDGTLQARMGVTQQHRA